MAPRRLADMVEKYEELVQFVSNGSYAEFLE
jgi:hypothetical protein